MEYCSVIFWMHIPRTLFKIRARFLFFYSIDKRSPEVIDVQSNYTINIITPLSSLISHPYSAFSVKCLTLITVHKLKALYSFLCYSYAPYTQGINFPCDTQKITMQEQLYEVCTVRHSRLKKSQAENEVSSLCIRGGAESLTTQTSSITALPSPSVLKFRGKYKQGDPSSCPGNCERLLRIFLALKRWWLEFFGHFCSDRLNTYLNDPGYPKKKSMHMSSFPHKSAQKEKYIFLLLCFFRMERV